MENIIETANITLDFDDRRPLRDLGEYRLSLYDKHGHYEDEFYISAIQLRDLIEAMQDYKIEVKDYYL